MKRYSNHGGSDGVQVESVCLFVCLCSAFSRRGWERNWTRSVSAKGMKEMVGVSDQGDREEDACHPKDSRSSRLRRS